jgi:hypothetical protein
LLITPVETTIGLGFEVEVEIHLAGVWSTSFSSEFLLGKEARIINIGKLLAK